MIRVKEFAATGVAPLGKLYAGDLLAIQDACAGLTDFTQTIDLNTVRVGDSGIQLIKHGTAEARITAALRTDGIFRGLGGLFAGTFTTTQRDAISAGFRPQGLEIFNTTTLRREINLGSDAVPNWQPVGSVDAIDYVQRISDVSLTSVDSANPTTILDGTSKAYEAGSYWVEFYSPGFEVNDVNSVYRIILWDGSTQLGRLIEISASAVFKESDNVHVKTKITLTAATHQIRIRGYKFSGGATGTVKASDGTIGNFVPSWMQVTKA